MTALCASSGTSSPKPGVASSIYVSGTLIGSGLALISPWLEPIALLINAFIYNASTNCTSDPPAQPTFTATDLTNCLGGLLNPNCPTTLAKVTDLINNYLWFQFCQCDAGAQPVLAIPTPPAGITVPSNGPQGSCFSATWTGQVQQETTPTSLRPTATSVTPPGPTSTKTFGSGQSVVATDVGLNAITSLRVTGTITYPSTGTKAVDLEVNCFGNTGTFISNPFLVAPLTAGATVPIDLTIAVPTGTRFIGLEWAQVDEPHPATSNAVFQWSCAGQASGVASPCVTDPALLSLLQQINQMLTLVQRQISPFGYIASTVHTGLTGFGQLAVSGLIGVKVTPTTTPPGSGLIAGDPDSLWLDSWIRWGNADGWTDRKFLTSAPYISLPELAGQFTLVGYTLAPGLTVSITELVREP